MNDDAVTVSQLVDSVKDLVLSATGYSGVTWCYEG